jgi:hypothetical protein
MFYAPYLTAADVGCSSSGGPMVLGDGKGPHGFILMFMNEKEKSKILEDNKDLLKRLAEYKPYFQINRS